MFDLFAQNNAADAAAFQAGQMIGIVIAMVLCFAIPLSVGISKGQPILGVVGGILAGGSAFPCGCLLGLPVAGVFVAIILATAQPAKAPRRRDRYDDDDYDRPRNDPRNQDDDYNPYER